MFDKTQPLWMPKGSVRSILALGLVAAVVAGLGGDVVQTLATAAVAFSFGSKTGSAMPEQAPEPTTPADSETI